jgi:hypothetical protein
VFAALPLFELFLFSPIRREIRDGAEDGDRESRRRRAERIEITLAER